MYRQVPVQVAGSSVAGVSTAAAAVPSVWQQAHRHPGPPQMPACRPREPLCQLVQLSSDGGGGGGGEGGTLR